MGKIVIHRRNETIFKLMNYHVFLNDKKVGILKSGETSILTIESGEHKLKIKGGLITYSNELKFSLTPNESKKFVAESFKNGFLKNFIQLSQIH